MDRGSVDDSAFLVEVPFEDPLNLIILPVSINGKTYRFLFDTGAPNIISPEIQKQLKFKKIGKSLITDSQGDSEKVEYVAVKRIGIGDVDFFNTSACVIDLKANSVLGCLELDGIIGSNLMRFCTWQVDFNKKKIIITNQPEQLSYSTDYIETTFKTNTQHSIKIDLNTENATIKNLKIDYGSTGSVSVPNKVYQVLSEREDLSEPVIEIGYSSSGIFGKLDADTFEISVIESGKINGFDIGKLEISSSGKGLLGTKILKNYIVTMNWSDQTIGFEQSQQKAAFLRNRFGLSPTFHNGNVIIKSVIINGSAYKAGLRPGMVVKSLNDFSFEDLDGFCDYVLDSNKSEINRITLKIDNDGVVTDYELQAE